MTVTEEYKQRLDRMAGLWLHWSMRPCGMPFEDVRSFVMAATSQEIAAEREACAKLVEAYGAHHLEHYNNETTCFEAECEHIAEKIRARGANVLPT